MARTITARTNCAGDHCPDFAREGGGTSSVVGYRPGMPRTPENEVRVVMSDEDLDTLARRHMESIGL